VEVTTMRTFIGMIFGSLLTVAAAYVHDTVATSATNGMKADASNTLVNWDVAAQKWNYVKETAHTAWLKLQSVHTPASTKGA
jgi:hypothetical protein